MTDLRSTYARLTRVMAEIAHLESAFALFDWEGAVNGGCPSGAKDDRSETAGYLSGLAHAKRTSAEYGDLLAALIDEADDGNIGARESAVVRRAWLEYDWSTRLPVDFVERHATLGQQTLRLWERTRATSDWKSLQPSFAEMVLLSREKAELLRHGNEPYDALLEEWSEGLTAVRLQAMLDPMKDPLLDLVRRIHGAQNALTEVERARFAAFRRAESGEQRRLGSMVANVLGFDSARGRLDESLHPFMLQIGWRDSRLTARYRPEDLFYGVSCIQHEMGHWLYAEGLSREHYRTPLFNSPSMDVDEGIARYYENVIGRSQSFLEWFVPRVSMRGMDARQVYRAWNDVQLGPMRLDADEVTNSLHVMLRVAIERPLINGALRPEEVPEAWNALSREFLDVTPENHGQGQMQDRHWYDGWFGYFPDYFLADLFAAQLDTVVQRELPDVHAHATSAGTRYRELNAFLIERMYRHGASKSTAELTRHVLGGELNPAHLLERLETRYGELYGL